MTHTIAPRLIETFGISANIAAELLIVLDDNPERVHSENAFARLCDTNPIPASSGKTTQHRLNRGGHKPTQPSTPPDRTHAVPRTDIIYTAHRASEGKTKPEITHFLKRLLAREPWALPANSATQRPFDNY